MSEPKDILAIISIIIACIMVFLTLPEVLDALLRIGVLPRPTYVEIIFDISGVMADPMENGETKYEVAKRVLGKQLRAISTRDNLALRLIGSAEADDSECGKTELVVPFGTNQVAKVLEKLDTITPHGKTAWVDAMLEGIADLGRLPVEYDTSLIAIIGGNNTCPVEDAAGIIRNRLRINSRLTFRTVHFIGFQLDDQQIKQLEEVAEVVVVHAQGPVKVSLVKTEPEVEKAVASAFEDTNATSQPTFTSTATATIVEPTSPPEPTQPATGTPTTTIGTFTATSTASPTSTSILIPRPPTPTLTTPTVPSESSPTTTPPTLTPTSTATTALSPTPVFTPTEAHTISPPTATSTATFTAVPGQFVQLSAHVWYDYRCDMHFTPGLDRRVAGATITLNAPSGKQDQVTDEAGFVSFNFWLAENDSASVSVSYPDGLVPCSNSNTSYTLTLQDFTWGNQPAQPIKEFRGTRR